jgi:hypothetical protein
MTIPSVASVEEPSRASHLVIGVVAVCFVVFFGAMYVYGSAARKASEQAEAALVDQEDRAFCAGLGLADKSEPYTRCKSGLTEIRQRQRARFDAESVGIL